MRRIEKIFVTVITAMFFIAVVGLLLGEFEVWLNTVLRWLKWLVVFWF